MSTRATVLFDAPGPRARLRNHTLTVLGLVGIAAIVYFVYAKFDEKGQWRAEIWEPFLRPETWQDFILPGLWGR